MFTMLFIEQKREDRTCDFGDKKSKFLFVDDKIVNNFYNEIFELKSPKFWREWEANNEKFAE